MALGAKASLSPYDSAWVKAQYAIAHNESSFLPLSLSPSSPLPLYFQIKHHELRTQQRMKIDFSRYLYGKPTKRKDEECCIYFTSLILLTKQPMS
jgi:hypothetical protein